MITEMFDTAAYSPESPAEHVTYAMLNVKNEGEMCGACGEKIMDKYLLTVNNDFWHVECLRCSVCELALERHNTCFIRNNNVYCRVDYIREFGAKCSKCYRHIQPNDWVRRARENVFHLACFACDNCKRQLSTGEEFALKDSKVLCKTHFQELADGGSDKESESVQKSKAKRVRTTFTEEQVQVLQANFQIDSNPDGQDLERIAQITGLSKRVTQVWFQNSRARQKKYQQQQHKHSFDTGSNNSSMCSPITSSPPNWVTNSDGLMDSDSYSLSD